MNSLPMDRSILENGNMVSIMAMGEFYCKHVSLYVWGWIFPEKKRTVLLLLQGGARFNFLTLEICYSFLAVVGVDVGSTNHVFVSNMFLSHLCLCQYLYLGGWAHLLWRMETGSSAWTRTRNQSGWIRST
jgi:hypothetical protein